MDPEPRTSSVAEDLRRTLFHPLAVLLAAFITVPAPASAQSAAMTEAEAPSTSAPRLVTADDYGSFQTLGSTVLSPDGTWLSVSVGRVEGDGEIRLHRTDGDSVVVVEKGSRTEFSPDGLWAAVVVPPGEDERERLRRDREPIRNDLVLVDLAAGEVDRRTGVQSFAFSSEGRFIYLRRYASGERDARGVDLVVRELATGVDLNLGNVAEAAWNGDLPLLAMVVDAEGKAGNGVRLYEAPTGTLRTLESAEARFSDLAWREDATDLAALREEVDEDRGDTLYTVMAWRDLDGASASSATLPGAITGDGGEELRITAWRGIRWADDGSRIFVGAVPREAPDEEESEQVVAPETDEGQGGEDEDPEAPRRDTTRTSSGDDEETPGVEIWHARDVDPVPQQRLRADQERRASDLVAWEVGTTRTVVLGGRDRDTSVSLVAGEESALFSDGRPYALERMFGPAYRDLHEVNVATGERRPLVERIQFFSGSSPEGRYTLFFEDDQWHALDLEQGTRANLTGGLDGVFVDERQDHTVEQRRPHGVGGWIQDDAAVLLYDLYDVWRVRPDGSGGERLTRGAEDEIRHRVVRLDPDQDAFPPDEPIYLSLYGEWTKDSGYARLHPDGDLETLVYAPRSVSRLSKAEEADRYVYVTQRYDLPPRVHGTDASFRESREIIRLNEALLEEFRWGRSELIEYENAWGEPLQAALFYPADFEPGRQYPMIVYPYERRSQMLHSWSNPSETSAYNTTVFTQNGYFVLQPDIVYRPRNPGLSFMEAVIPAVDAALEAAPIDRDRVGLTGHSWGGYQTTFAVTQTDRFAAAVAGAPLTNLVSMYLSFYWNSGGTDARIFEISQGRMEVPWWEDYESYRANSPVHHIEQMDTPLLMAFGTEDGAVEFNQGVEFYNAARRAGKDFVLLVYEGENHSLRERPNQVDYHRRSLEWFNHYLKGTEAPAWITDGVPYLEQVEQLKLGPAGGRR